MISIEVTCDHSDQPRARDGKHPCDSTRNKNVTLSAPTLPSVWQLDREAAAHGWKRWAIPAFGLRMGYICGNCYLRAKGEI